ncbi:nucleotidyltransferase family protein [Phaeocystidibacter marisrubri]|uniref:NTP transferase domain-containing protein n=1 Tax=Phaeocystidibacter marisrubri TaxID=1577780 RepID=A0A6L3ZIC9_9FLAO|nr:nucleotidyltransferase family protein [Phaeocystidibacter marisrubri]KAB2817587.1 NTP transferase domain-containing protein [Phaeocystidibacter marisrubri]GGH74610.1 hypothetical protein GCM10011318_20760 [Phaeocystidibacter marisrubri]
MIDYKLHLIPHTSTIRQALERLNELAADAILFAVDEAGVLIGSLTDGDVRRGLISGKALEDRVSDFVQSKPKYITKDKYDIQNVIALREGGFRILPVVDSEKRIVNVINFRYVSSYLPMDAIIMAGGKGTRLLPMTKDTPKPLLKIGGKAIIEHGIDRLRKFGVDDIWISINYLGDQIEQTFKSGEDKGIHIKYIQEDQPLGTIGSVSYAEGLLHDYVLVTNSDILTELDYEEFFLDFLEKGADMSIVTIPYRVDVPYAVLETSNHHIISFKEKPTYTYYSNGGIYLIKRELLNRIPKGTFYNSTDLMQDLVQNGFNVVSFPLRQYWLDIGKPDDFQKAQEDIKHLDL